MLAARICSGDMGSPNAYPERLQPNSVSSLDQAVAKLTMAK
jgi:hypothetical protein